MTAPADLEVVRGVRRVLVKHWIDLGRLSIRSSSGHVMVFGMLQRIEGVQEKLTTPIVETIMYDMKRMNGVRRVTAHLENWKREGGLWKQVEAAAEEAPSLLQKKLREQRTAKPKVFRVTPSKGPKPGQ